MKNAEDCVCMSSFLCLRGFVRFALPILLFAALESNAAPFQNGSFESPALAPDASVNFMPNLWARIESRQRFTFSFRRMANVLTTAAMALSLALGIYMAIPRSSSVDYNQTYVEALAESNAPDTDMVNPANFDAAMEQRPNR